MADNDQTTTDPFQIFLDFSADELTRTLTSLKEINLLVEQSQGEVEKLAQRNAASTAKLHQLQAQYETMPREDIRATYEAAQDTQQRLFTMSGQLEKLESDQKHLKLYAEYISKAQNFLEGGYKVDESADEQQLLETDIEQIINAQEEERRRISRQIHDGPAQALSNFILQTEIALRLFDNDMDLAREELQNLKKSAAVTFGSVRDFIFDLRPMMLDDLGLVPTARRYTEAFKDKTGLDITFVVTGTERRLESHREVLLFRSIQELLGNIRDHAQATQGKVTLIMDEEKVQVTLEDNGRGFDTEAIFNDDENSHSLNTLRDRIRQMGGEIDISCPPEGGTHVVFHIPTNS